MSIQQDFKSGIHQAEESLPILKIVPRYEPETGKLLFCWKEGDGKIGCYVVGEEHTDMDPSYYLEDTKPYFVGVRDGVFVSEYVKQKYDQYILDWEGHSVPQLSDSL